MQDVLRVEDGVSINLDWDNYETRVVFKEGK